MTFKWAIKIELQTQRKALEERVKSGSATSHQRHALRLIREYNGDTSNATATTQEVDIQDYHIQLEQYSRISCDSPLQDI